MKRKTIRKTAKKSSKAKSCKEKPRLGICTINKGLRGLPVEQLMEINVKLAKMK